jgi:uncharacterized protein YjdB
MKTMSAALALFGSLVLTGCEFLGPCTQELGFSVTPSSLSVRGGQNSTIEARAWSCGGRQDVDIDMQWTSSDTTIARVNSSGRVTGVRVGNATVQGADRSRYGIGTFNIAVTVQP